MPEKIGSDVLGGSEPRISPKKRKELEQKFREEQAKKRAEDKKRIEELLIEGIPGEIPHEATPEERAEIIAKEQKKKKRKTVLVTEHYRSPPSSSGEQAQAEDI